MKLLDTPSIVVVDDSQDDFELIRRQVLKKWPRAALRHVSEYASLVETLNSLHTDLVICDYRMPKLTHQHVMQLLQTHSPPIPLILLSGMGNDHIAVDSMSEGVRDYIEKSKPERLVPAIEREIHTLQLEREKAQLEKAHQRAVFFDEASGFLNRQGFKRTITEYCEASDQRFDLCLITASLARQTRKTLALSPAQEKALLGHVRARLRRLFVFDIVCQWSDNLIVVLIDKFDWQGQPTELMLERLAQIEAELSRPVMMDTFPVHPQFLLGLARPPIDGRLAEDLVQHARSVASTLYTRRAPFTDALSADIHALANRRQTIASELGQGIEHNQLQLQFQPVQCLNTDRVVGLEALVRWEHSTLGTIMPDEFIGVAEDSGLICALGQWVIEKACITTKTLHNQGYAVWCAINCSTVQLLDHAFPSDMQKVIESADIDPKWIEFEITETAAIDDMALTLEVVRSLQRSGAKVVLDDFGTGYSSLNYLRQLPLDVLKIDKSFIKGLLEDENSHKIVKAVIDLAHALGLEVHAEGIETDAQKGILKELECDRLQGYLFGRPMQLEQLQSWFSALPNAQQPPQF